MARGNAGIRAEGGLDSRAQRARFIGLLQQIGQRLSAGGGRLSSPEAVLTAFAQLALALG